MIVLVLNCGSSSLKYQVLDMRSNTDYTLLAKGLVERIGEKVGDLTHKVPGRDNYHIEKPIADHTVGIKSVLDILTDKEHGVLSALSDINAVGHRVAHGGEFFFDSVVIDKGVIEKIEKCCELAPLHNPANLLGIKAVETLMPGTPQVAVFDTSFHQTMPKYAYMYAIPYQYYEKYKIRRYGFHGTSHKYVSRKACELFGTDFNNSKIITCHLGNGSSITAIKDGKSVDTSMGFTPVEGLPMGTRSGNVDAGIIMYLMEKEGLSMNEINKILNKKSGLIGISELSSDNRDLDAGRESGNEKAALAQKMLWYTIKKYIGGYIAALNGVDMIVFTGGIGENSNTTRENVLSDMEALGIVLDKDLNNQARGKDMLISKPESKVKVAVVTTDEELVIARDTMNLTTKK